MIVNYELAITGQQRDFGAIEKYIRTSFKSRELTSSCWMIETSFRQTPEQIVAEIYSLQDVDEDHDRVVAAIATPPKKALEERRRDQGGKTAELEVTDSRSPWHGADTPTVAPLAAVDGGVDLGSPDALAVMTQVLADDVVLAQRLDVIVNGAKKLEIFGEEQTRLADEIAGDGESGADGGVVLN